MFIACLPGWRSGSDHDAVHAQARLGQGGIVVVRVVVADGQRHVALVAVQLPGERLVDPLHVDALDGGGIDAHARQRMQGIAQGDVELGLGPATRIAVLVRVQLREEEAAETFLPVLGLDPAVLDLFVNYLVVEIGSASCRERL